MLKRLSLIAIAMLVLAIGNSLADKTDPLGSLEPGKIELTSAGPLAFGPQGILFIGDPKAATIYAVDTGDRTRAESSDRPKVEGINQKIGSMLGTDAASIQINDLAVNPISGTTFLSVSRGKGPTAPVVLVRVDRAGKLSEFPLNLVKRSSTKISNAAEGKKRLEAITHLAYVNGKVMVAGLSNEEFASKLRTIPYPFDKTDNGSSIEIYHGAHGQLETRSPIRVFAPYKIGSEDHILAAYTCTPLVKIPVASLEPGKKFVATTVAELGNRNRPLSMLVYQKGGKDYVLLANNARGLMKIPLDGIDKVESINKRIADKAGLKYETIKGMEGVMKLDGFDKDHAVVLIRDKSGKTDLTAIELP